jgi:hypothetical protein
MKGRKSWPKWGNDVAEIEADAERRTDAPMAFTWREVWRGAWTACGLFVALVVVLLLAMLISDPPEGMYASLEVFAGLAYIVFAAVISAVATLVLAPVARLISIAMQQVRQPAAHVAVFGALGAALGQMFVVFLGVAYGGTPLAMPLWSPFSLLLSLGVALCTALGWVFTYRRSRHPKPRKSPLPPMWG